MFANLLRILNNGLLLKKLHRKHMNKTYIARNNYSGNKVSSLLRHKVNCRESIWALTAGQHFEWLQKRHWWPCNFRESTRVRLLGQMTTHSKTKWLMRALYFCNFKSSSVLFFPSTSNLSLPIPFAKAPGRKFTWGGIYGRRVERSTQYIEYKLPLETASLQS